MPQHRIHIIASQSAMFSGKRLEDCKTWDDETCEGGIAMTSALLRHSIPENEPSLVIPHARTEEVFDQMHPLSWAVWRLLLHDRMGWNLVTLLPSVLLQNKVDSGNGLDLSDFQTHDMPLLFTNVAVPPTNSWSPFIRNVHFDEATSTAILWIWNQGQVFQTDAVESTLQMLNYIEKINKETGCIPAKSLYRDFYSNSTYTYTHKCWKPIVFVYAESPALWERFLSQVPFHSYPPAVILGRSQFPVESNGYLLENTWIVEYDDFSVGMYKHFAFTVSEDSKSILQVEDVKTNILPEVYKDDQWKADIAYLRTLADEAIANDPVVGNSTSMPLTRIDNYRGCMRGECEIANLLMDSIRWKLDADVAFCNSGGPRGPGWEAGTVHISDIWAAFPFPNTLCQGVMSGVSLFKLMDYSMSQATFQSTFTQHGDRLLQVSGMRVVYNNESPQHRIVSIDIWDRDLEEYRPIERLKLYKFAATNYLCFGMDPFPSFLGPNFVIEGEEPGSLTDIQIQAAVAQYLRQLDGPYQARIEGRLVNDTYATETLDLVETRLSCKLDYYWVEEKDTCFSCISTNVAFSSAEQLFKVNFGQDAEVFGEILLVNDDSSDVRISPKDPPYWIELVGSTAGNVSDGIKPILLKANTGIAFQYQVKSSIIESSGIFQGAVSFAVLELTPGCLAKDASFQVTVEVSPEADLHHLGGLRYAGITLAGITIFCAIAFSAWVWKYRSHFVVRVLQPMFLLLICLGVVFMSASLVPFSLDDGVISKEGCDMACNAIPWLLSMGFTIAFSALNSKLWRINRIVKGARRCQRTIVQKKDVLLPFAILFSFNFAFLLTLTLVDPLSWVYEVDLVYSWSSYGRCAASDDGVAVAMLGLMGAFNAIALILACIQAWHARGLSEECSEAKYLGFALYTWLQFLIVGLPVLFLIDDDNVRAKYFITIALVFAVSMSMLLIIFVPLFISFRRSRQDAEIEDGRESRSSMFARRLSRNLGSRVFDLELEHNGRNTMDKSFESLGPSGRNSMDRSLGSFEAKLQIDEVDCESDSSGELSDQGGEDHKLSN